MGCDIEKLEYLSETKQLLREKIDPKGAKITDETHSDHTLIISVAAEFQRKPPQ